MSKKQKPPKLEQHLLQAMRVIDNRVARQMQRTPAEREVHGVQKWEPYRIVVEDICALLLNEIGDCLLYTSDAADDA